MCGQKFVVLSANSVSFVMSFWAMKNAQKAFIEVPTVSQLRELSLVATNKNFQ